MRWKRITVGDLERILVANDDRFAAILPPGDYWFRMPGKIEIERHDVRDLVFRSLWEAFLVDQRPDMVNRHFVRVETSETQIGMVYLNGSLYQVLTPAKRVLYWRDAGAVSAEIVDVISTPAKVFALSASAC